MNYSALIVAAGQGSRMKLGYNKMFYTFKDGETVLQKTIRIFEEDPRCTQIVVVTSRDDLSRCLQDKQSGNKVFVVGGETRQDSVYNGLMAVRENVVLIHDGARPYLKRDCIDRLLSCLEEHEACLLTVPVKDTVKIIENGQVLKTPERSTLQLAQTPQAFKTSLILSCYRKAQKKGITATDDAQLAELCSDETVWSVEGDYENIKITTPEDIRDRA